MSELLLTLTIAFLLSGCKNAQLTTPTITPLKSSTFQKITQEISPTLPDTLDYPPLNEITPDPNLTLKIVEERLLGAWLDSAYGGYWAARQNEDIIPLIVSMFPKMSIYKEQHQNGGRLMGIFPYNGVYALAHIKSPEAKAALEDCIAKKYSEDCTLALEAWEYRSSHPEITEEIGFARYQMKIYEKSNLDSKIISTTNSGTKLKLLDGFVENANEGGPRGGSNFYWHVIIIDTGLEGYIETKPDSIFQFI